ncbi:MAG TPA: ATP-binding cassette domain-containing protein [Steroidobacteraceae bacterium]|nr:ATP-binding cassette domain-containing protein [Steroidobacteraceae bacterium]
MLSFSSVCLRRGTRVLFDKATFTLFRGEKIGITGANGAGKSSLLSLVRGDLQPDIGSFERPTRIAIAHVAQELAASDQPAIEFVMDGDPELRDLERRIAAADAAHDGNKLAELHARFAEVGGYDARSRAGRLLHGLGFEVSDEARSVNAFSGGWRVRLNVAQALMCRSDLLLLDEPTNHLDLDAVIWLESWLNEYRGTLLMISHDREFLDRIITRVVNIENAECKAYSGNYAAFEEQRAMQLAQHQSLYERQQREISHMMSFVNRFRAAASKARQAQSRLKALERMQRIAPAHVDTQFEFAFLQPEKLPQPLLAIDDQTVGYGDIKIIESLSLTIAPGDRIALLGRNGAGKSTLTKLLAGELKAMSGKRIEARDLKIGYFAQHQLEQLFPTESPLAHLKKLGGAEAARAKEQDLRGFLGTFGFSGDRVFEPVGPFSGGEKARLVLALVSYLRPNLLLLDEPTNHLDLEMRQALAVALQEYAGAVVLVSHDRHLLRTVADQFYIVSKVEGRGRAIPFDGDLEDYARWLAQSNSSAQPVAQETSERSTREVESAEMRKQRKREEAERRNRLAPMRANIAKLEKEIDRLSKEQATIRETLADSSIYEESAKKRLLELTEKESKLGRDVERVEALWLEASSELEAAERDLANS